MAWTGKATYDNATLIGQDVSPLVALIGPTETPFLAVLSDPAYAGTNVYHEWTEESLGPNTIIASAGVNSATAATGILINALGKTLQAGMFLKLESSGDPTTNEIVQITSAVGANSILVSRNLGSRGVSSLAAGGTITVLGAVALEGADADKDTSRDRSRVANVMQIIKKDILISGTDRAVSYAPDLGDEFSLQIDRRTREVVRDLEKFVISGVCVNSAGSSTAYRSMKGLQAVLTGINSVVAASSFTADPVLYVHNVWQEAYNAGARDIDIILAGPTWKRDLSGTNAAKLEVQQGDTNVQRLVETWRGDFGVARVILSPWMPASSFMLLASDRIKVVPLRGRSFQSTELARTGDSYKAQVVGEYTLEVHQAGAMGWAHV